MLAVPKNMKLLAIPLFELYDNAARYVPNICAYTHIPAHADLVRPDVGVKGVKVVFHEGIIIVGVYHPWLVYFY